MDANKRELKKFQPDSKIRSNIYAVSGLQTAAFTPK